MAVKTVKKMPQHFQSILKTTARLSTYSASY